MSTDEAERQRAELSLSQKGQLLRAVNAIPTMQEPYGRRLVARELANVLGPDRFDVRNVPENGLNTWLIVSTCLEVDALPTLVEVLALVDEGSPALASLQAMAAELLPTADDSAIDPDIDERLRALLAPVPESTVELVIGSDVLRDHHASLAETGDAVLAYELLAAQASTRLPLLIYLELVGHQLGSFELHRLIDDVADRWGLTGPVHDLCATLAAPRGADQQQGSESTDYGGSDGDGDVKITIEQGSARPVDEPVPPLLWGGVPPRNNNFTGREDLLERIHGSFTEHVWSALVPQPVHGLGGIGKSQMAVEYAYRYQFEYQLVWWIQADDDESIHRSLRSLGRKIGVVESDNVRDTSDAVLDMLRRGEPYPRWLLIYDNSEEPSHVRPYLPSGGEGHVLITSRSRMWASESNAIEIDVFTPEESVTLLRGRWPELTEESALTLAGELGHLPLALEQAAALHEQTGIPLEEYLHALQASPRRILAEGPATNYPVSVAGALDMAFQAVEGSSPAAAYLLRLCAFLSSQPISIPLLVRGRNTHPTEGPGAELRDDLVLRRAVRELGKYALVQLDAGRDFIRVHALIRALIRDGMPIESREAVQQSAHALLAAANPRQPDDASTWPQHAQIAPHIGPAGLIQSSDEDVRQVMLDQIRYRYAIGDYAASAELGQETVDSWRASYGLDDELTLVACRHLANSVRALGRYEEARALNEDTLTRLTSTLGRRHEHTLTTASSVGADLRLTGAYREALALDEETVAQHRDVLGPSDPATLRAINNLADDYRLLGQFTQARALDEENIARRSDAYGADNARTLFSYSCLMRDLYGLGQYQRGLALAQEKLPIYEQKLPADHASLLLARRNMAILLRKAGHYGQGLTYSQKLYDVCRVKFGRSHEHTLSAQATLANSLRVCGQVEEALRHGKGALASYLRVFGEQHPFTLACQVNVAIILRAADSYDEANHLAEQSLSGLTAVLGEDHPHTLCAAATAVNGLASDGRADDARALGERTWQRSRQVRGPHHPNSLACAANLALDLEATGQEVRATKLRKETLEMFRAQLGTDHPETVNASSYQRMESDIEVPAT